MEKLFEYIISPGQKEERLDHFLGQQKEIGKTRTQVKKLIEDGFIKLNLGIPKASHKVKPGDRIEVIVPEPQKLSAEPEQIPLDIVYEDEDLVVVNKARGMVVHPAVGNYTGTLVNALLYHAKDLSGIGGVLRPGIVHRLDKDTSGLLVVAKNDFAHQALAKQFKEKKITKEYVALVHGVIKEDGQVEAKIGRHPHHRKKMAIIRGTEGREALTCYRVLKRFKEYTLVELSLKTGRTHQIRVHLTSLGHAIVGDPVYGHRRERFNVLGQLLHAKKLGFVHPRSSKYIEFEKEMPEDMLRVISILQSRLGYLEPKASQ
ncbi:MAG: RluA family pseudouridine synthase [Candidatus Saganbacteria bacterium]|nr:RluA family pseudouridine synthase [Candidatus Saganbacteria bacterium]